MKTLNSLFVLMIGLSALLANAQKADSVIVIYDNQKTVIPVPAFGSQTTIKMADSIKIIEIGVLRRRAGDNLMGAGQSADQGMPNKSENARKQVQWFSQIGAGYSKSFTAMRGQSTYTHTITNEAPITVVTDYEKNDITGYQLGVLLRESEYHMNERISFITGLKIGFAQTFNNAYINTSDYDTAGYMISDTNHYYDYRSTSFRLTYQVGFSYNFQLYKTPSKIVFGNGFLYSIAGLKDVNNDQPNSSYITTYTSILNPYVGAEIGKFGILISMDLKISGQKTYPSYLGFTIFNNNFSTLIVGLTFRLY